MSGGGVAVVRGPGGLPGLDVHCGAWLAMEQLGIEPAWVSGCSAGAIVSAMQATGMPASQFERILTGLRSEDVVKKRFAWKWRALWADSIADPEPIRALLTKHLPGSFEELELPLTVSATWMSRRQASGVVFDCGGRLREAVLASMSIAGFWPYAMVGKAAFSDGGTTCQFPLPPKATGPYKMPALDDFDRVIVLNPSRLENYRERDENVLSRLRWNVDQLMELEGTLLRDRLAGDDRFVWIDLDMGRGSSLRFDHHLIETAHARTHAALAGMTHDESPNDGEKITPEGVTPRGCE